MNKQSIFEDFLDEDDLPPSTAVRGDAAVDEDDVCNHGDSQSYGNNDVATDHSGLKQIHNQLFNTGFRTSKVQTEEAQMQVGFDQGFQYGMEMGRRFGQIYALFRQIIAEIFVSSSSSNSSSNAVATILLTRCDTIFASQVPDALRKVSTIHDRNAVATGGLVDVTIIDSLTSLLSDITAAAKVSVTPDDASMGVYDTSGGTANDELRILLGSLMMLPVTADATTETVDVIESVNNNENR